MQLLNKAIQDARNEIHTESRTNEIYEKINNCIGELSESNIKKRKRIDLIRIIAALEEITGNYKDEISDKQYN